MKLTVKEKVYLQVLNPKWKYITKGKNKGWFALYENKPTFDGELFIPNGDYAVTNNKEAELLDALNISFEGLEYGEVYLIDEVSK